MITKADEKVFVCSAPALEVNNAAVPQNVIDTQGFRYLRVEVILGATDIGLSVLKVQESDVKASATALTGGTDVTGTVFGTDKNDVGTVSVLPGAGDGNKVYSFEIDLRGRKRYLLPVVTVGAGSVGAYTTVVARLARAENSPTTAAQKGFAQLMRVPVL